MSLRWLAAVGAAFCVLLFPVPTRAARVIGISLFFNGKPLLTGTTFDNGYRKPHQIWRDLENIPLHVVPDAIVDPDPANASVATLKGWIRIEVRYSVSTDASTVHLVRCKQDPSAWSVARDDVERIAKRLGLPEVTNEDRERAARPSGEFGNLQAELEPHRPRLVPPTPIGSPWAAVWIAAAIAGGLAAAYAFAKRRRKTRLHSGAA